MTSVMQEGYEAFNKGKPMGSNPYLWGNSFMTAAEWTSGWKQAEEEAEMDAEG